MKPAGAMILVASLAGIAPGAALADESPAPIAAVVKHAVPAPKLATMFVLNLSLPHGQGLARLLLDAGVATGDAADAERLAAGHCGGLGGCAAKVEISRRIDGGDVRIERLVLAGPTGRTVIERRNGRLTLNPAAVDTARAAALS